MPDHKGVLFIGHHASRTGAPLLLLHFLRWLADHSSLDFEVLLTNGGELVDAYSDVAPTRVLNGSSSRISRLMRRVGSKIRLLPPPDRLVRHYPVERFPLVYSNTVANGEYVGAFGQRGHRVICHAHEMKFAIEQWGGASARRNAMHLNSVIAASRAVKRDISRAWNIREEHIDVVHEFGQPQVITEAQRAEARTRVRSALHVNEGDVLVAMCGTMDWRKGGDVFLQLARTLLDQPGGDRYRFVWIGGPVNRTEGVQLRHDLEMLGVGYAVTIAGPVDNPQDYLAAADVFTLTSREDPCPLAMIEAAALGLPIVCFAQSGGATDFVGEDAGVIVPYLAVESMADAVAKLGRDPELRDQLGRKGRSRAEQGYSLASQAPKLLAIIERQLAASGGAPLRR